MRLFSLTSKLCLLTLLLMLVYGGDGQGEERRSILEKVLQKGQGSETYNYYAGKCGTRPLYTSRLANLINWERSPAGTAVSNSTANDPNVKRRLDNYSQERIVGGRNAYPGEFPWQASVRVFFKNDDGSRRYVHNCGAVIISKYWLLSAAHCFKNFDIFNMRIHVGDHDLRYKDEAEEIFTIENAISHEDYFLHESGALYNDIALIKIRPKNGRGIQFSRYVQPACLPDLGTVFPVRQQCLISGWGDTHTGKEVFILQGAQVPLLDQNECQYKYDYARISMDMICAGYPGGKIDSCRGDSGGPLVCNIKGAYTLCGIVSWGDGCAQSKYPGVYARVTTFLPWIRLHMS